MVQINLLPETAKKKQRRKVELRIALGPIIFFLFALMLTIIMLWAMLGMQLSAKHKRLSKLDAELKDLKRLLSIKSKEEYHKYVLHIK